MKCSWLLPTSVKDVPYAPVADIDFRSAKKLKQKLDDCINNLAATKGITITTEAATKVAVPVPGEINLKNFYAKLNSCKTKAVALSLIHPFSYSFVSKSRDISTISDLFHKKYFDLEYHDLLKRAQILTFEPQMKR